MKETVVSGIRPTGDAHIGNYLGMMRDVIALQEDHLCFYFVADLHALTTHPDPKTVKDAVPEVAKTYLACGVDPKKSTLYVQSSVPAISELSVMLGNIVGVGALKRCKIYQTQIEENPKNKNFGLLGYPVLMAADILAHQAGLVPVGEDQMPHLEMARDFARSYNHVYGNYFVEPGAVLREPIRVPGIDGKGKMSKSKGNTIDLRDSYEDITKKVLVAPTDPARVRKDDAGSPDKCPVIYELHKLVSDAETVKTVEKECPRAGIGCKDCKLMLVEHLETLIRPIRENFSKLDNEPKKVIEALEFGGKKAREHVKPIVEGAGQKMGINKY